MEGAIAPSIRREILDNGLTVIVQPVRSPLVSVWCWYRVGSRDEEPGMTGASHWVEHMNFKGTHRIPRDQMKGLVERVGGMWNGYTWIDQTTYVETAGRRALDQLLFLEAERMTAGLYDPAECESERTVVISELQGGENDPDQLLDDEVTAAAFNAHPYRHPTIGWLDDLTRITRDELYGHYRHYYVPNNAALVIVGGVDADETLAAVRRHFESLPAGSAPRRVTVPEPPQTTERRVRLERPGTTAYLKAVYHAPAALEPDFFPMLVLDTILTGPKGLNLWSGYRGTVPQRRSRLYRALVDKGLASSVSGALMPTIDPYLYTLSFTATDGVPLEDLEAAVSDAIERVRSEGVTPAEVVRAQRQLRARLVFENDSVTNAAHQLGFFETVAGPGFQARLGAEIAAVTAEHVWDVAKRRMGTSTRTVGWFEPTETIQ